MYRVDVVVDEDKREGPTLPPPSPLHERGVNGRGDGCWCHCNDFYSKVLFIAGSLLTIATSRDCHLLVLLKHRSS